ncbi:MAG: CvpA family protein [Rhodothermales bacterium]|nr:CvpA family protein [Rhodothermales bacterium]
MLETLTGLDLLILGALTVGLVVGWRSGLIKQALSLVGGLIAFLLALSLMHTVGAMLAVSLGLSSSLAPLLGFVLVFVAIQVGVFALVRLVEKVVGVLRLGLVNRMAGSMMGAGKAALALSIVFLVLAPVEVPSEPARSRSAFYAPVAAAVPAAWDAVRAWFPRLQDLSERFGSSVRERIEERG